MKLATFTSCGHKFTARVEKDFTLQSPECHIWYFKSSILLLDYAIGEFYFFLLSFKKNTHVHPREEFSVFAEGRLRWGRIQPSNLAATGWSHLPPGWGGDTKKDVMQLLVGRMHKGAVQWVKWLTLSCLYAQYEVSQDQHPAWLHLKVTNQPDGTSKVH